MKTKFNLSKALSRKELKVIKGGAVCNTAADCVRICINMTMIQGCFIALEGGLTCGPCGD